MADYTELATYVKNWANRDIDVLDYDLIRQCIRYAHDECYRTLRIAPLEITRFGTVTEAVANDGFLRTENDLVEFIQLRKVADKGPRSYSPYDKKYIVAEAHSDARSFQGDSVTLYSNYAFYREGYNIYIFPRIKADEVWELYYYRRLPEANERFGADELIANEGLANSGIEVNGIANDNPAVISFLDSVTDIDRIGVGNKITVTGAVESEYNIEYTVVSASVSEDDPNIIEVTTDINASGFPDNENGMVFANAFASWTSSVAEADFDKYFVRFSTLNEDATRNVPAALLKDAEVDTTLPNGMNEYGMTLEDLEIQIAFDDPDAPTYAATDTFIGVLKEHWLRDINEKVLLFGALHQAFDYLDETDQSEKYKAKFEQEIAKLNKEDMDRMNSGGNIQTNFFNQLL